MNEVKIKAYGILELSKKQYLLIQRVGLLLIGLALFISQKYDFSASEDIFVKYIGPVCLVVIFLELGEIFFMLRAFRKKEISGD